jgi:hypothetical protein
MQRKSCPLVAGSIPAPGATPWNWCSKRGDPGSVSGMRYLMLCLVVCGSGCLTAADVQAQLDIAEARLGSDVREEAEDQLTHIRLERAADLAALAKTATGLAANPVGSLLEILLGGGAGALGLNLHRNRKRKKRGEPPYAEN